MILYLFTYAVCLLSSVCLFCHLFPPSVVVFIIPFVFFFISFFHLFLSFFILFPVFILFFFFFSSRRWHTRCALLTGVQTCALPIYRFGLLRKFRGVGERIDVECRPGAVTLAHHRGDVDAAVAADEIVRRLQAEPIEAAARFVRHRDAQRAGRIGDRARAVPAAESALAGPRRQGLAPEAGVRRGPRCDAGGSPRRSWPH